MSQFSPRISKVKGISDVRRMPRLGKIRLGVKKLAAKSGREYPVETDYFVCPPEVCRVFGDRPKSLEIMFPINDVEAVFPQAYTLYGKVGVKCKGDGEVAYRARDFCGGDCHNHNNDPWHKRQCPCELLDEPGQARKGCGLRGHLLVMLPRVSMGGVYQIDTGSYHSTVDLNSGIAYVQELLQVATGQARFALVPLLLERVPRKTSGGESGAQQTHYTLRLTCNVTLDRLAEMRKDPGLIIAERLALPEPEDVNPETEPVDVVEEEDVAIPMQEPAQQIETQAADNKNQTTIGVEQVKIKEGVTKKGAPYVVYTVLGSDGNKYGTFDQVMGVVAKDAYEAGCPVVVEWVPDKYGRRITSITMDDR